jgi:hypothetical protein
VNKYNVTVNNDYDIGYYIVIEDNNSVKACYDNEIASLLNISIDKYKKELKKFNYISNNGESYFKNKKDALNASKRIQDILIMSILTVSERS